MISNSKRNQLEAAGYSVSKSGKTVTKDGGTIAGINDNGNFFGSGKALDILKGASKKTPKKDSDTKAREKPKERKAVTSSRSSSAPTESKRPKQRQMGRGEPNYGEAADKPVESPMGGPRRGRKPTSSSETPTRDRREGTILLRSDNSPTLKEYVLERVRESGDSSASAQRIYREEYKEKYGLGTTPSSPSTGSSSRKSTRGMAKGGMVRKGNTSYKDKGMFYKSASPRGYK